MSVKFIDLAGWEFDLSDECGPNGSGACDGWDDYDETGDSLECACVCHTTPNLPRTTEGVARLHRRGWAAVPNVPVRPTTRIYRAVWPV